MSEYTTKLFNFKKNKYLITEEIIREYVEDRTPNEALMEKYNIPKSSLLYIVQNYIKPEYHKGDSFKGRRKKKG